MSSVNAPMCIFGDQPDSQNTNQIVNGTSPMPSSRPRTQGKMSEIGFMMMQSEREQPSSYSQSVHCPD